MSDYTETWQEMDALCDSLEKQHNKDILSIVENKDPTLVADLKKELTELKFGSRY
jgi:hypothetical protein